MPIGRLDVCYGSKMGNHSWLGTSAMPPQPTHASKRILPYE